jgi:hypothetical protein
MRVVVTKNPLPVGIMERERVADAVRDLRGRLDPPCLDLDPLPVALINDLLVQIEQGFNTGVASHTPVYQLLIKISSSTNNPLRVVDDLPEARLFPLGER